MSGVAAHAWAQRRASLPFAQRTQPLAPCLPHAALGSSISAQKHHDTFSCSQHLPQPLVCSRRQSQQHLPQRSSSVVCRVSQALGGGKQALEQPGGKGSGVRVSSRRVGPHRLRSHQLALAPLAQQYDSQQLGDEAADRTSELRALDVLVRPVCAQGKTRAQGQGQWCRQASSPASLCWLLCSSLGMGPASGSTCE